MKYKYLIPVLIAVFMISFTSAGLSNGLVAYYEFNLTTGDVIDSLYLNNGTNYGATRGAVGIINNSFDFENSEKDNVTVLYNDAFNFTDAMTINVWINLETDGYGILQKGNLDSDQGDYNMLTAGTGEPRFRVNHGIVDGDGQVTGNDSIPTGSWYMVTGTYNKDDGLMKMYINGSISNTSTYSNTVAVTSENLFLGCYYDNSNCFDGLIDEMGFWNRALTDIEISQLYNSGSGLEFTSFGKNLQVTLTSPLNNTNVSGLTEFNASIISSTNANLTNATLSIWYLNSTLHSTWFNNVTGNDTNTTSFIVTNLTNGTYLWNVEAFEKNATDTNSGIATENLTFNYKDISFDSIDYKDSTVEGDIVSFSTIVSVSAGNSISSGNLWYNGTSYSGSIESLGSDQYNISRELLIPDVTALINVTFFWEAFLSTGLSENSSSNNISVNIVGLDDCSAYTTRILNYTLYDEDTQSIIPNGVSGNGSIAVYVRLYSIDLSELIVNFSGLFNSTNNASVCISNDVLNNSAFSLFSNVQYKATDYEIEHHNIQNLTLNNETGQQNISLFDLPTSRGTDFQLIYKDSTFLAVPDAVIQVQRQYLGEGLFKTVEAPITGSNGKTVAHLVRDDELYTFVVLKNGIILSTFENQVAFCQDIATENCVITLNALSSSGSTFDYDNTVGIAYSTVYNETSRLLSVIFATTTGTSANVSMNVVLADQLGNTTVCDNSLVSSSGTLSCTVPQAFGNETVYLTLYLDGEPKFSTYVSLSEPVNMGVAGYFLIFIMIMSLVLMFAESKTMTVISVIIGFIAGSLFFMIKGGIMATGSAIMWLIVAGVILIYKLNSEGHT